MKKNFTSIVTAIISLILIIAGTIGLILLQKPIAEESLDIRQQASVDNGQVLVTSSPASGSQLKVDQETTINFQANTAGIQTDGVQLVFNLITNTLSEVPVLSVPTTSGLQSISSQVQSVSDGYLVSVIAVPQQIGSTFSSTSPTTVTQLKLKPTVTGDFTINFDREKSKSIIHATNPTQDSLTHIETLSFTVADDSTINPTPTPDPTPTPTSNPTPTPSSVSNGGGITIQGCNDSCSSNAECETNHRCYNGQCRLVTNVSSTTCTEQTDQGLSFGCDEYCADSNECDDQFTCLDNRCRRSDNPDDSSCQTPDSAIQNSIADSCNKTCASNNDCAANLRCYNQSCRLATNVSSSTCDAATAKTVSNLYLSPTTPTTTATETTLPKGGSFDPDSQNGSASDSTTATNASIKASPSPLPGADDNLPLEEKTALDTVINSLRNAGVPINLLPIIALVIGGLLMVLVIVPKIFSHKTKTEPRYKPTQTTPKPQESELQVKIDQLKNQPPKTSPVVPPTAPTMPTAPTPMPTKITPPPAHQPTHQPIHQPAHPQSPILERMKKKGINPSD